MTFGNIITEVTTLFGIVPEIPILAVVGGVVVLAALLMRRIARAGR